MKIDLIANDGSPLGVIPPDIDSRGVGGAEMAMMKLMQTFAERGHQVSVYNDPRPPGTYSGVEYRTRGNFNPRAPRDVLVVFRSPNPLLIGALASKLKVWWSTDQYTVGSFKALSELVDYCVTISPYHTAYHQRTYEIPAERIGHIDLGVRLADYERDVRKIENRLIYCSVPDRGLAILHAAWPLIKREVPNASLTITSDYTLWGVGANDVHHRLNWAGMSGVEYLGKVNRGDLVRLQLEAEILAYPCTYEELFCLSAAECQVAGCFPVTTGAGALPTTNSHGLCVTGDLTNPSALQNNFVDRITSLLRGERGYLEERRRIMMVAARMRFDWNVIAERWETLFEEGTL